MRAEALEFLRCAKCAARPLALRSDEADAREIRAGALSCAACGASFAIRRGIPDLLDPDDQALAREVAGWETLAGELGEGLVPTMTALPWYPHPPWPHVAPDFFQIFEHLDLQGARILDFGAGRCWSSRHLAALGEGAQVVAVDVLTKRFLGLETADIFMAEDGSYFERLRADAHRLPIVDGWFDLVVACASVHHSGNLFDLFRELARVLRPGGFLVFLSEPSKAERIEARQPDNEETRLGINEHIYSLREYEEALAAANLGRRRRLVPRSIALRLLRQDPEFLVGFPARLVPFVKHPLGRRLLLRSLALPGLGSLLYRMINLPLTMVAQKPA